jgi:hypothetical protein
MTGGGAEVSDKTGEAFEAWDGYISGVNLELEPPSTPQGENGRQKSGVEFAAQTPRQSGAAALHARILQAWRTVEFADDEEDSLVEIRLEAVEDGTRLTLHHSQLPAHGAQYEQGWIDNYFEPMKAYFGELGS